MKLVLLEIKGCFDCPFFSHQDDYCFKLNRCISIMFDLQGEYYPEWCPLPNVKEGSLV